MKVEKTGYVKFDGHKTYYEIVGKQKDKSKLPLLVLHGGPGSAHYYVSDLQLLAKNGRQVIFYDQLGCGKSDRPKDESIYTIDLFLKELSEVRKQLGLQEIHLLGQSWGGMLAIEYMLTKPKGIHGLVLASSMISLPLFQKEVNKLRRKLPLKVQLALNKHEKAGTVDSPEYEAAYKAYRDKHIYRPDEWPKHLSDPLGTFGKNVYRKMWGYSEACANGDLKNWDVINRLPEIIHPTLITSGKYDELTPKQAKITKQHMPHAEQVLFEHSAHLAHVEEIDDYMQTVEEFLERAESKL